MGEHGRLNKGQPYKTSAGVPFIIRYPNHIKEGKIVKTSYSSPDFAPTILSLMGIDYSDVNFQGIDGSDELLDNNNLNYRQQVRFSANSNWAAAVDREYKLVLSNGPPILFDLKEDPDELYNFHGNEKYRDITEMLEKALFAAMRDYNFSISPSPAPTFNPTIETSSIPSRFLAAVSSTNPSASDIEPSSIPSKYPSIVPSTKPSASLSATPSHNPTIQPSSIPGKFPSAVSSARTTTSTPLSATPSHHPTIQPSSISSTNTSTSPSPAPTFNPTIETSSIPSRFPAVVSSANPSTSDIEPSSIPSKYP